MSEIPSRHNRSEGVGEDNQSAKSFLREPLNPIEKEYLHKELGARGGLLLDKIYTVPDFWQNEILDVYHHANEGTSNIMSRSKLTALSILNKVIFPFSAKTYFDFQQGKITSQKVVAHEEFVIGLSNVVDKIIQVDNRVNAFFNDDDKNAEGKGLDLYVELYKANSSGHSVVSRAKNNLIFAINNEFTRDVYLHPELVIAGAELAQRAYYALYPLTASFEQADSRDMSDFVPGRGWGRRNSAGS